MQPLFPAPDEPALTWQLMRLARRKAADRRTAEDYLKRHTLEDTANAIDVMACVLSLLLETLPGAAGRALEQACDTRAFEDAACALRKADEILQQEEQA